MIYSELIDMAINELGLSKIRFASEIGVSVTTLYRILNNETLLPSNRVLDILSNKGIDISLLNYNDIYYNYIQEHYYDEYRWVSDIRLGKVELRHKKCHNTFWVSVENIANYERLCPYCHSKNEEKEDGFDNNNDNDIDIDFDFEEFITEDEE